MKITVDCVDHIVKVIKKSGIAELNKIQHYDARKGFQYLDIKSILGIYFKKLSGIQKFQHFLFETFNPSIVKAQKIANRSFYEFNLLKTKKANIFEIIKEIKALFILVLTPSSLNYKRQEYFYNNIRSFVKDEYKDITCLKLI